MGFLDDLFPEDREPHKLRTMILPAVLFVVMAWVGIVLAAALVR